MRSPQLLCELPWPNIIYFIVYFCNTNIRDSEAISGCQRVRVVSDVIYFTKKLAFSLKLSFQSSSCLAEYDPISASYWIERLSSPAAARHWQAFQSGSSSCLPTYMRGRGHFANLELISQLSYTICIQSTASWVSPTSIVLCLFIIESSEMPLISNSKLFCNLELNTFMMHIEYYLISHLIKYVSQS